MSEHIWSSMLRVHKALDITGLFATRTSFYICLSHTVAKTMKYRCSLRMRTNQSSKAIELEQSSGKLQAKTISVCLLVSIIVPVPAAPRSLTSVFMRCRFLRVALPKVITLK